MGEHAERINEDGETNDLIGEDFRPQEIAFRKPGGTWKRRTVKTAGVFDKLIDRLNDEGAEVRVRDAE